MVSLGNHLALVQWVCENGGYSHENITVAHDDERCFHLQVKPGHSISTGVSLLRCPMDCVLTVLNALDTPPFSCHGSKFPDGFLHSQSSYLIQYFYLMEQRALGEKSWWAPYIRTLQDPEDLPEFVSFGENDLPWIKGTHLELALKSQVDRWKDLYSKGLKMLTDLNWPSAIEGRYTWKLFLWAVRQFDSRSFTPALLADTLPAEKATSMGRHLQDHALLSRMFNEGFSVLIPLLDLTSHKPLLEIDWKHNMSDIGIDSRQLLEGGMEVCNNYGPKDNETLLLAYGFTIPNNPFDIVLVNVKAPQHSPLEEARKIWQYRKIDHEGPGKLHIRNLEHPDSKNATERLLAVFSNSLLISISTLVANDREVKSYVFQRDLTMALRTSNDDPTEWQRNIVATCAQLAFECKARLALLNVDDQLSGSLTKPLNPTQEHAKIYRDSQQSILSTGYWLCLYELMRSRSDTDDPEKQIRNQMQICGVHEENVPSCIESKPLSMVPDGVMVTSEQALAMLDHAARIGLDQALQEIKDLEGHGDGREPLLSPRVVSKIRFAVFLAFADLQKGQNPTGGPRRLTAWLDNLDRWYPLSNPDLTLPTEELLPLLEPLLNISPEEAWSQELICWAWSVTEEETVAFPIDHSQSHGQGRNGMAHAASELELLLYIPQSEGWRI